MGHIFEGAHFQKGRASLLLPRASKR